MKCSTLVECKNACGLIVAMLFKITFMKTSLNTVLNLFICILSTYNVKKQIMKNSHY